jgi:hypothetical protein
VIHDLTIEKLNDMVQQKEKDRLQRLAETAQQQAAQLHPPATILEVHMGCTIKRILAACPDQNVLPRGVLSLIVFPRGNEAHLKFLQAAKDENRVIQLLSPV